MRSQVLDSMDLERERGITIKAQAVRVHYTAADGQTYQLNLIDTPGHVDFSYEVSRSLAACEGALLVVDASQGIEAQTLANAYLAIEGDLELIPVLNKIDLPAADPDLHGRAVADLVGEDPDRVLRISAKTGQGVDAVLEAIVERVPPPAGDPEAPARALIFDSVYDQYRGVVAFARVVDGAFQQRDRLRAMQTGLVVDAEEIGVMSPAMTPTGRLGAGETGYLVTGLKSIGDLRVGDTLTVASHPAAEPLPGYREVKPMVFCGLFPVDADDYPDLRDALEKLSLNDASLRWEPETSQALGFGFRCGFLGLLHMDIVRERLEREYDLELLATTPNVEYQVTDTTGVRRPVRSPTELPPPTSIERIEEPYVRCTHPRPAGGRGRGDGALPGPARRLRDDGADRAAPADRLRPAPGRDRPRLLRPAEVAHARLRLARLRDRRLPREPAGEARRAARGRHGRRALDDRPPRPGVRPRQGPGRAAAQDDPAPALRRARPGRHRRQDPGPRDREGASARTCSPSATAATSAASGSCSSARRRARSG